MGVNRETLLARVLNLAEQQGITRDQLGVFLRSRTLPYPNTAPHMYASAEDVCAMAAFFRVPPSYLFEVTHYKEDYGYWVFKDLLPQYQMGAITEEQAWAVVRESVNFRGQEPAAVRKQVGQTLVGLRSPGTRMAASQYPDCDCAGPSCCHRHSS